MNLGIYRRGSLGACVPVEDLEHGSWEKAMVVEVEPKILAHFTFPWFAEAPCNPKLVSVDCWCFSKPDWGMLSAARKVLHWLI